MLDEILNSLKDTEPTLEDRLWEMFDQSLDEIANPKEHVNEFDTGPGVQRAFVKYGEWLASYEKNMVWTYRHFREMQTALDKVTQGELKRVIFQIPIRHGKTEHNTIRYAVYRLVQNPATRFLICSYNQRQANKLSRWIRRRAKAAGVKISKDRDSTMEWETEDGGGVIAVGVGAGVASVNADVIIIDDPIGRRKDAESEAVREEVWDWLTNDILARCEPHTAVLFTMSRWHTDDPVGRFDDRQKGRWFKIDLPAVAEACNDKDCKLHVPGVEHTHDPIGRQIGEPLWPELRDENWLDEKFMELGSYGFASLLQGRPRPREGAMFKWEWWEIVDVEPVALVSLIRYWDLAGTRPEGDGHDPDYSAGALLGRMRDQRTAIVDIKSFRKSVAERDAEMLQIARSDLAKYRGRIRWWIETEAGIQGKERTQSIMRRIQALGMPCYTEHPTGSKESRAEPLASAAEVQNVVLVAGSWNDRFRLQSTDFPNGKHDDEVDSAAGAFAKLESPHMQPARRFVHRV